MGQSEVKIIVTTDSSGAVTGIKTLSGEVTNFTKKTSDEHQTMSQRIKGCWLEISAVAFAAYASMRKGWDLMELGAKAQQAEEAFRTVTSSYKENADQLIADLKRASNATIDESNIMQKAIKGLTQDLSGKDLTSLMEVARIEARRTGQDVGQTFDELVDAVSNNMPRALKRFGLITKEEMKNFETAVAEGHTELSLLNIVLARGTLHMAAMGGAAQNTVEEMQQLKAEINEVVEFIGKLINKGLNLGANISSSLQAAIVAPIALAEKGLNQIGIGGDKWQRTFDYRVQKSTEFYNKMMGIEKKGTSPIGDVSGAKKDLDAIDKKLKDIAGQGKANDAANAMLEWKNRISELNSELTDTDKELLKLYNEAEKLKTKAKQEKWGEGFIAKINEGLLKGSMEIYKKAEEEEFEYYAKIKEEERAIDKKYADESAKEIMDLADKKLAAYSESFDNEKKLRDANAVAFENINKGELASKIKQYELEKEAIGVKLKSDLASHKFSAYEKETIEKEANEKLLALNYQYRDALLASNASLTEGMAEGIKKYIQSLESEFQKGLYIVQQVTAGMENAFMGFFDYTSKSFLKFGALASDILHTIYQEVMRVMIIKPLVSGLMGLFAPAAAGGYAGGGTAVGFGSAATFTGHEGGLVMHEGGFVPRFHFGGLSDDEVPAILQRGEYVVSRKGVATMDAINQGRVSGGQPNVSVVLNVQNNTGMPVQAREGGMRFNGKQMVKEIILELKRTDPGFNSEMARGY